jgi:hypothetical protein
LKKSRKNHKRSQKMKTTSKLLAILALALSTLGQNSAASAANVFHFKGNGADAFFSSVDSSGCVYTDVFVQGNEQTFRNPPTNGGTFSGAFITISQYDGCAGMQLLSADGFAELASSDFQVSGKFASASLNTTISVFDHISGTPFDVNVSLTWTGTTAGGRQNSTSHYDFPGCKVNSHYNNTFRFAEASGSVATEAVNLTPAPPMSATIFLAKSGDVNIGCGL